MTTWSQFNPCSRRFRRTCARTPARAVFSWAVRATFFGVLIFSCCTSAWASDGPSPSGASPYAPPWLGSWLANLAFIVGIVYVSGRLIQWMRGKPPPDQRFALRTHEHSDQVTHEHFANVRRDCKEQREAACKHNEEMDVRLFDKLDEFKNGLSTELHGMERRIGDRIDPLAANIAANKQGLNQHLDDHRSGRAQ